MKNDAPKSTILIVDDHQLLRQTWEEILNKVPLFKVIATTKDGEEALRICKIQLPNIVLMDIQLDGKNGMEYTREITTAAPSCKVIGVSSFIEPAYVRKMFAYGAKAYVTKSSSCEEMITAIYEVCAGRTYMCKEMRSIFSGLKIAKEKDLNNKVNILTTRELEIIEFVKAGLTSTNISERLGISRNTVETHRSNILRKLHLKNTSTLVAFANKSLLQTSN